MSEGGMLSLSWNNHIATFAHTLASVREKERYTDVTLSCEGNFYPVHKLVLASCSEYFMRLFEQTPCKHPVIVLQEVRCQEMEALLSYMYAGVVSVAQSDLPKLIKVAETLQIKGLAVPDENLCNNMKFGHTWSPTNDHTSPFPKKHHREDNGTQTQTHRIIEPRRGGGGHSPQSAPRYGPQNFTTIGSSFGNSMPHRFSPYSRDTHCKTIHRSDNRKEHIIIPRVTPKMEYKNEGKMYGQHHHARPDTTTDKHDHRIARRLGHTVEKSTDPMSDEGRERVDTEDENSSEMHEMLPVSLVKVEVKEEEDDDVCDGMSRECSPPMSVGPPQDQPLPLLHPRLPTPPQERHHGAPGVEGGASQQQTLKREFEEHYEEIISQSESEPDSEKSNKEEDPGLSLKPQLGLTGGSSEVTVTWLPPSNVVTTVSSETNQIPGGGESCEDIPSASHQKHGQTPVSKPHQLGSSQKQTMKEEIEDHYEDIVSESESELSSLLVKKKLEASRMEDPVLPLNPQLGFAGGNSEVTVTWDPSSSVVGTGLTEMNQLDAGCSFSRVDSCVNEAATVSEAATAAIDQKTYKCRFCPYTAAQNYIVVRHMRTHTGERPYPCPHCSYRGIHKSSLNVHMRTHSGVKPFICPHCPARFTQNAHLKDHLCTHTGEKPFACPHCTFRCINKSGLNRHLKRYCISSPNVAKKRRMSNYRPLIN